MSTFEMHYCDVCGKAVGEYEKKRLLFERPLPTRVTFIGKKTQKDYYDETYELCESCYATFHELFGEKRAEHKREIMGKLGLLRGDNE